jgi:hypothetical protein
MKGLLALAVLLGAPACGGNAELPGGGTSDPPCDDSCAVHVCRVGEDTPGPSEGGRARTVGTNGTFDDRCAGPGDVVQYYCAVKVDEIRDPQAGPNPGYTRRATGSVVSETSSCGFGCFLGACIAGPPPVAVPPSLPDAL